MTHLGMIRISIAKKTNGRLQFMRDIAQFIEKNLNLHFPITRTEELGDRERYEIAEHTDKEITLTANTLPDKPLAHVSISCNFDRSGQELETIIAFCKKLAQEFDGISLYSRIATDKDTYDIEYPDKNAALCFDTLRVHYKEMLAGKAFVVYSRTIPPLAGKEILRKSIQIKERGTGRVRNIGFKILDQTQDGERAYIAWVARGFDTPYGFFAAASTIPALIDSVTNGLQDRGFLPVTNLQECVSKHTAQHE